MDASSRVKNFRQYTLEYKERLKFATSQAEKDKLKEEIDLFEFMIKFLIPREEEERAEAIRIEHENKERAEAARLAAQSEDQRAKEQSVACDENPFSAFVRDVVRSLLPWLA